MKKFTLAVMVLFIALGASSCRRPYDKPEYVDILPNETAFVVPLEAQTLDGQAQVRSLAFLEESKVQSKRIRIPHRWSQTGRHHFQGEYLPTMQVIKVDRSPVSREWTASSSSGTSNKAQAIWVESSDSIEFSMAISMTAQILEEDTAIFLYRFSGRSLAEVMDSDLRSAVMTEMNAEFGSQKLSEATLKKVVLVTSMKKKVTELAKEWGITITTCGSAGGMVYRDSEIQKQINDAFKAEKKIYIKDQLKLANDKVRLDKLADATNATAIANEWAKTAAIQERKTRLEIDRMEAEAKLKWTGCYPEKMMVLPEGNPLLLSPGA